MADGLGVPLRPDQVPYLPREDGNGSRRPVSMIEGLNYPHYGERMREYGIQSPVRPRQNGDEMNSSTQSRLPSRRQRSTTLPSLADMCRRANELGLQPRIDKASGQVVHDKPIKHDTVDESDSESESSEWDACDCDSDDCDSCSCSDTQSIDDYMSDSEESDSDADYSIFEDDIFSDDPDTTPSERADLVRQVGTKFTSLRSKFLQKYREGTEGFPPMSDMLEAALELVEGIDF